MLASLRLALSFLTIIPVGRVPDPSPGDMGRLPGLYPLVGLVLGLIGWAAWRLLEALEPPPMAQAVLLVTLAIVLTRGFHLDGLADAADALLSHRTVERKLEILKDSHLGTFGVAAIVLDVMLKVALVEALGPSGRLAAALVLYPVFGRLTASAVAYWGRSARSGGGGLGHHMIAGARRSDLALAIVTALAAGACAGRAGLTAALAALALGRLLVPLWRAAIGGVTGDLLGASVELGELLALALLTVTLA